ncbi:MAG: hypothetical protein CMH57_01105, partial [Myxococcales bacterium]|nr:hypothetical protein [Myxococcales bacterium]
LMLSHARGGESPASQESVNAAERGAALRKLGLYLVLVMIYTFGVNGVLRADLFLLKSLLAGSEGAALDSDMVAGVYAAMLNLARLPYQAVIAVTFVVFPMISRATFESDMEATRGYIRGTLRYSFLLLSLLGVLIAGNSEELVLALYGERFVEGAAPLMLLSLATIGFALFFITTTMITGAGKPVVSVALALVMMAVTAGLNYGLIQGALGSGEAGLLMNAAATATAGAMVSGCVAAVGYLVWRFKAGLPLLTLARGGVGAALVFAALLVTPTPEDAGRVMTLALVVGKGAVGAALFTGWLALTREFGPEDMDRLGRIMKRKSRA